jgi:FkbM family methyltransferase
MYFEELAESFLSLQGRLKPDFIIEVGAREASFSLQAKKLVPDTKVYAFEANPYVHKRYARKCKRRGVNYLQLGVSNLTGNLDFNVDPSKELSDGSHSFLKRVNSENLEQISVGCTTLDDFFMPKISESDNVAIWIDVEGLSGQVLEGATKLLSHVQSLYIEVEHKAFWENQILAGEVTKILESRHFMLLGRDLEYFPVQENFLFLNPWRAKFI